MLKLYETSSVFSQQSIVTARIRRMGEGTVFSLVFSPHLIGGGRYPSQVGGTTPSQVWLGEEGTPVRSRGVPHPSSSWGVPHPRFGWGDTPSQVWMGRYPITRSGWGTPPDLERGTRIPGMGYPFRTGMGYPPRHGMGYPPRPGTGYPPDLGWGTPLNWDGDPPA